MTTEIQAPEGALREVAKEALDRLEIYAQDHCWPVDRAVCDRLRAALAAQPQAPLSERAILDLVPSTMPIANDFDLLWFARAVERAHGIPAPQTKEQP